MSKQQTAVEWFNQQLVDRQNGKGDSRSWNEILEQANQMFQEQIMDAYENGVSDENESNLSGLFTNAEQYYNQTYKK